MRGLHIISFTRQAVSSLQSQTSYVSSPRVGTSMTRSIGILSQLPPERVFPCPARGISHPQRQEGTCPKLLSALESQVMEPSSHFPGCSQGYLLGREKEKGTGTYRVASMGGSKGWSQCACRKLMAWPFSSLCPPKLGLGS